MKSHSGLVDAASGLGAVPARRDNGACAPDADPHASPVVGASAGYMAQLDGIRAFAVGAVLIEHWASGMPQPVRDVIAHLDLGGWGVECFFVLSGFLITSILLDAKSRHSPFSSALGHFYGRRALRIFPAYYLVLAVTAVMSPTMRDVLGWHALYLSNLYPMMHDGFPPTGGHFWSLAVEEQFYLFWPLLVLLLPKGKLVPAAIALCALAPLSRSVLWHTFGEVHLSMWTFPTTALDLLGFGALLACFRRAHSLQPDSTFVRWLGWLGWVALLTYLAGFFSARSTGEFAVVSRTLAAVAFGALIMRASFGFSGFIGWLLGNRVSVWLGMVSYGLYLIHPFVPHLYLYLLSASDLPVAVWGVYYIRIPLMTITLLGLTAASFYLWERPIRSYRRLLPSAGTRASHS